MNADTRPEPPAPEADAIAELNDLFSAGEPDDDEIAVVIPEKREYFRIPSGKYKGMVLPRMIGVKPSYFDKVMALKNEIERDPDFVRHADSIALTYAEVRRETEILALKLSEAKLRLGAVQMLMLEQYEVEGTSALTLHNGDKVRWQPEPHLVVTNKEDFRQWCIEQQLERDMVLPWGKANKFVKEMKINGRPEPPGAEVFMRPKVFFTRGEE
jgi:hypothetical protein